MLRSRRVLERTHLQHLSDLPSTFTALVEIWRRL